MKNNLLLLVLLMGPVMAFTQSNVFDKINVLNKEMEKEFNTNNMQRVASYYLDSATIIGGGMNVTGRKNIDSYWMSLKDQSANWRLETDKIEDYDQIIIQRGRSYLTMGSGGQSNVRFILIWKKTGNSYRILYDTFFKL
jgi:ketosteroid isomerase-like protein